MFATDEKHFLLTILGPHLMPKTEIGLRTGHLQKVGCLLGWDVQELGGNKTIPIEASCGGRYDPVWGKSVEVSGTPSWKSCRMLTAYCTAQWELGR